MADRIADSWGPRTPYRAGADWSIRTDMFLLPGIAEADVEQWSQTASVLHSNGDAMDLAQFTGEQYRAKQPGGRAFLHAVPYPPSPEVPGPPPPEVPGEDYPLPLTPGRVIYHFHTRTKTGRTPQLRDGRDGVVFVPFHYGYWDQGDAGPDSGDGRAANELALTGWDPVSKQPIYKVAAVRVTKLE